MLRELGVEVVEAPDGRKALDEARRNPDVGLMLVDWVMPEMNGLDFVRAIRSQHEFDAVRILMVTSECHGAQVSQALDAGADEYLMKPFDKEALVAKLQLMEVLPE